jgi:hypothetical protein
MCHCPSSLEWIFVLGGCPVHETTCKYQRAIKCGRHHQSQVMMDFQDNTRHWGILSYLDNRSERTYRQYDVNQRLGFVDAFSRHDYETCKILHELSSIQGRLWAFRSKIVNVHGEETDSDIHTYIHSYIYIYIYI